jgi:hypothetical protein
MKGDVEDSRISFQSTPEDALVSRKYIWISLTCVVICETYTLSFYLSISDLKIFLPESSLYFNGEWFYFGDEKYWYLLGDFELELTFM